MRSSIIRRIIWGTSSRKRHPSLVGQRSRTSLSVSLPAGGPEKTSVPPLVGEPEKTSVSPLYGKRAGKTNRLFSRPVFHTGLVFGQPGTGRSRRARTLSRPRSVPPGPPSFGSLPVPYPSVPSGVFGPLGGQLSHRTSRTFQRKVLDSKLEGMKTNLQGKRKRRPFSP